MRLAVYDLDARDSSLGQALRQTGNRCLGWGKLRGKSMLSSLTLVWYRLRINYFHVQFVTMLEDLSFTVWMDFGECIRPQAALVISTDRFLPMWTEISHFLFTTWFLQLRPDLPSMLSEIPRLQQLVHG